MLDLIFFTVAVVLGSGGGGADLGGRSTGSVQVPAFEAEPQTPTGKFTTAAEVKPIMGMTKGNWVAVREFNGQDLLYVTHIMSWRCGMHQMRYAVNGGEMQTWPLPPCYADTSAPNAIKTEDGLPYMAYPPGSIETVEVEILYDDLSEDSASFTRSDVLMP